MQPLSGGDPVQVGPYRLRGRLGAGGMGQVFLASTPAGRSVALKVVRPELSGDQEFRARFRQEIAAAQRVRGLYTAELVDADPEADPPWLATAYVPGPSLQQVLDSRGPLPEAGAFRLVAGVAEALQAIHAAGVVHRDLKPSNVLIGPDGPRVIDFGIARALEGSALTQTGMAVGTPQFMAPEQLLDQPVTPMIDVFALGALAACAVLGRPPFGGGHPAAMHYRVLHEPPDLNGCPPRLRTLIESCLAKEPADRPRPAQILQYCLQHADMTAAPVRAQAPHLPTEIVANRQPPFPPTLIADPAPQSSPAGTSSRAVPPRRITAKALIYLGGLLAIGGVVVAVTAASPAVRGAMHLPGAGHSANGSPPPPAAGPCTPKINAAGRFGSTATQTVEITGGCFGTGKTAAGTDTAYFRVSDLTAGWNACWTGDPNTDFITCSLSSWTNQKITFSGFAGEYGQNGYVIADGDHIRIEVWNPQSGKGPAAYEVVAK
jgi:eukaryotic-like serine/threonine-protein kinase